MLNIIRAELRKMIGHRGLLIGTLLIFPIVVLLVTLLQCLVTPRLNPIHVVRRSAEFVVWTEQFYGGLTNPIGNGVTVIFFIAFIATWFAGEDQWNTWKNIIPRVGRTRLILSKWIAALVLIMATLVLTSLTSGFGWLLYLQTIGSPTNPLMTSETLSAFASGYVGAFVVALFTTALYIGYAAIGAMMARSTIGGVILGTGLTLISSLTLLPFGGLAQRFDAPWIADLYRFTPVYNLDNAKAWILTEGTRFSFPHLTPTLPVDSLTFSLVMLAVWIIAMLVITLLILRRRDITA